jgi:hypothetical protein
MNAPAPALKVLTGYKSLVFLVTYNCKSFQATHET